MVGNACGGEPGGCGGKGILLTGDITVDPKERGSLSALCVEQQRRTPAGAVEGGGPLST